MICHKCNIEIADSSRFCSKCGTPAANRETVKMAAKKCPLCKTEYPSTAEFCKLDGQALREVSPPTAPVAGQKTVAIGRICPVCGTSNPLTAKFCRVDGTALQAAKPESSFGNLEETTGAEEKYTQAASSPQRQHAADISQETDKGGRKTLIWGFLAMLLLVGGGAGGYYFHKTSDDTAASVRVEPEPMQSQAGNDKPMNMNSAGAEPAAPVPAEHRSLPSEISRDRVKNLIDTFLNCSNTKSYQILDLYADRVNTFSGKTVTKTILKKDAEDYFNRWNNVRFTSIDDFVITDIFGFNSQKKVEFRFSYQLENARKSVSGISQTAWIVELQDGQLKIVDQKENIISKKR